MQEHTPHVDDSYRALESVQEPSPLFGVEAAAHVFVHEVESR